ncbi:MAG: DUF1616 domain-containing protein [Nitrososphaerota archaeon]|jgi:uncharacterized membrane protein|nr:DUF1616 domain-containing protein [Nitrososphaerota archaeon]
MQNNNNHNHNQTISIDFGKTSTAIAIVIIIVNCIIGAYLITYTTKPPGYHEMYILDNQNKAENYPQTLIINQNNTFNTPLVVTNNMRTWQEYQIQIKIVHHTIAFPVDAPTYSTYEFTLDAAQSWNNQIPITINEEGAYSVVFELYTKKDGNYTFTNNFCILHIDAVTDT